MLRTVVVVTHHVMEWRLFLASPVLDQTSLNNVVREFQQLQELLHSYFPTTDEWETRSDQYFVLNHFIGMKYRHGKKLELKLKSTEPYRFGVEEWTKYKLGKAELEQQMDNIIAHIIRAGYPAADHHKFRQLIQRQKIVEVNKRRKDVVIGTVSFEYCTLVVDGKSWISIAVESFSPEQIHQFLMMDPQMHRVLECIHNLLNAMSLEERQSYQMVVSGYPFWVQFANREHSEDQRQEALAPLRELFLLKGFNHTLIM